MNTSLSKNEPWFFRCTLGGSGPRLAGIDLFLDFAPGDRGSTRSTRVDDEGTVAVWISSASWNQH